ncbi:hypothetical protein [Dysgonomonas sp. 511]|uniref:hypothetical protein n=1 Tax=Dysgonomonas sp. 511 TaxID=2302930 RepID=UPI0013D0FB38|nr:hypothetical protein [Dysgonomonas sp. 511]NDV77449.1 hypothetical protein [Dysgonomonas sp. 511]
MILFFNPGHETAVLNGSPFYTAPANVVSMQQELAYLPAWYGGCSDVVLVPGKTEEDTYYAAIRKQYPHLPMPIDNIKECTGQEVSLWGISPQAIHYFETLQQKNDINLVVPKWNNSYLGLNNRRSAHNILSELVKDIPQVDSYIIPRFCTSLDEIEAYLSTSTESLIAKAPYSSSGRGLLWLPDTGLTRTERQILHGILKKQGSVGIERVLDKQVDFAMEFMCDGKGKASFHGYSLFDTNAKGGYEANYIGPQEYIEDVLCNKISSSLLMEVCTRLERLLGEKYAPVYKGCIGVDMMIYKDKEDCKLHPCLEVNMRYNMGYLALKLYEKYICSGSQGKFYISFDAKDGKTYADHLLLEQKHPAVFDNNRLKQGYLPLCPVNKQNRYHAYVIVDTL